MRTHAKRASRAVGRTALLLFAASTVPARLPAQVAGDGPAVVTREEAYLDSATPVKNKPRSWPVPTGVYRVLLVYFATPPAERPDFWTVAEWALSRWSGVAGLPVRFEQTTNVESADIRFRWIEAFDDGRSGSTDWHVDADGILDTVTVTLPVRHADSFPMSAEFLRLVALHEVGHALGLPHSEDPGDVMHPGNRNSALSPRDIRTVRWLYGVAPRDAPGGPARADESS